MTDNDTQSHHDWWGESFAYRYPVDLSNPMGLSRRNEPVSVDTTFREADVHPNSIRVVDPDGDEIPSQVHDETVGDEELQTASVTFLADVTDPEETYYVYADENDRGAPEYGGIQQLEPQLDDGVKRLDTGHYVLELCRGTADGTAGGKWGIRYLEATDEGRNLIQDCGNAIGGFYGPFFTPENGKVNPPEHTKVSVTTEAEGPVYARYRFEGTVPPGLDPRLRDKDFEITWEFFADTPWFRRRYDVDPYRTVVDGMPVENKVTVGDEFESGQGEVVLSQFGAAGGTCYREGDRYANILADKVEHLLSLPPEETPEGLQSFKDELGEDLMEMNWDYFWRLFCVEDDILSHEAILDHVDDIVEQAHREVHHSDRKTAVQVEDLVTVPEREDQTIFPMNADKTVELNPKTGYGMVWYTSEPVARYQIVQRPASGWVNWGTNGENEYPELPIGTTIYSGYDQFDDWEEAARKMEYRLEPKRRRVERL
jgi:hypothetical protein